MINRIKKNFLLFASSIIVVFCFFSCAQNKLYKSFDFTKQNIFTKGIEGPATDLKGNIYAVNYKKEGTVGIVNKKGEHSFFLTLPNKSIGNGIRFDKKQNMYIVDYVNHNIFIVKKNTKKPLLYAHNNKMNQPNDLAISPKGIIYLSDPNWKEGTGNLWMVKDKQFVLLETNMGTTNGIEVSPDGKKLYVNESLQRNVWQYDIKKDGRLENKSLFKKFPDFGLDGMRCDSKGNLYICRFGKGSVVVLSPKGKKIREIFFKGKKITNITFNESQKQCFVTVADRGCIESFYINNK